MIEIDTFLPNGHGGYAKALVNAVHIAAVEPIRDPNSRSSYAGCSRIVLANGYVIESSWPVRMVSDAITIALVPTRVAEHG